VLDAVDAELDAAAKRGVRMDVGGDVDLVTLDLVDDGPDFLPGIAPASRKASRALRVMARSVRSAKARCGA
jgi:hypothetical protein